MKKTFTLFAISSALLCASDKKTSARQPVVKQDAPKQAATTLPDGAVEVDPYTHRYTDAQGKKWLYRQTPFGLVKMEDKPAPVAVENATPTKVTDLGESVKFERSTPFGVTKWTKKKADLTDDEKALVAHPEKQ